MVNLQKLLTKILTSIKGINTVTSASGSVAVNAQTVTQIASLTLGAGTYLVISYMDRTTNGSVAYNNLIQGSVSGYRVVRSTDINGGGNINALVVDGNQTIRVSGYSTTATTLRVTITAIRLGG